ncbi:MAG: ABC transporter permease, partial [Burkholderiales bacterium]
MILSMLAEAWSAMGANRLRTFLTMLGMVIGVAAVVAMLAVGQGAQMMVNQTIASMGSNLFIVLSGGSTSGGLRMGSGSVLTLTLADADAIAELPGVAAVAPVQPGNSEVIYGASTWSTQVYGTLPSYLDVREWPLASGEPFTDYDLRSASRVALLGGTVANYLFGDEVPVGKTIRIRNSPYLVIGVLARKGQSLDGRDQDDTILVPVTTAQRKLFGSQFLGTVRFMMVQAVSADLMDRVERDITELLRARHRLNIDAENDFTVRNLTAAANAAAATTRVMSLMLGAIASVSLLVGGIGIMNIMLVSVTERTREIGIRMAIGATEADVQRQFLIEAVVLSLIGGAIGIVVGVGSSLIITNVLGWPVLVSPLSIVVAVLFSAAVGIFFGFYP